MPSEKEPSKQSETPAAEEVGDNRFRLTPEEKERVLAALPGDLAMIPPKKRAPRTKNEILMSQAD